MLVSFWERKGIFKIVWILILDPFKVRVPKNDPKDCIG
jgi:hypothetical protein